MAFEPPGVEEAVVDVVLEVSESSGDAAEVVEVPVGLASRLGHTEPVRLA
ncbi:MULTISPECIES: hypothetical protein [unclassified Schaalia]|nr:MULTISPECIES: hypothetical protein [unclassified Schaalia]